MQPTDVQFFFKKYTLSVFKLTTYFYALNTLLYFFIPQHIFKHKKLNISVFINNIYDVTSTTT